ncbi:uncharacterized protein LOC127080512 isoform X1 [Lathyrus oleraceus]|uniref:Transmembrane protein n=1 Tax=Pisum sativum TaxID=3888 RepID=A0A9D4WQU3_PEA|nr:uncharacterized protein LOC127080512 isoform X1 [Pisum sativum]KAI5405190.1 hypothetical protein KIW84_052098 [Pisum sativum]
MLNSLRFQPSNHPPVSLTSTINNTLSLQQPNLSFTKPTALPKLISSFSSHSPQPPHYISTVGSSSLNPSHWKLTQRHLTLLQAFALVTAIFTTWLFGYAIPTILAFKKAAESLEKVMDTAREELPDTMTAVKLSAMEISDLTTELTDFGQEITQGVRSSTRAVRSVEQGLRGLTTMPSSSASLQGMEYSPYTEPDSGALLVGRTARDMKEGIIKGRSMLKMFFSLAKFSSFALNFITRRGKR